MRADRTKGFTLLELTIALALVGFVMLGGMLLLDQLTDSASRIGAAANASSDEGNGRRVLRTLILDAVATGDTTRPFRGDPHTAEFDSNCDTPAGWKIRCRAILSIDVRSDSSSLVAQLSTGETYALWRVRGGAEFRYRRDNTGDSLWLRHWLSTTAVPPAIGIISAKDSVVMPVGAR